MDGMEIGLFKPKTYYMYHQFKTFRNSVFSPQCSYVFCMDLRKKQRLFLYTALMYMFL